MQKVVDAYNADQGKKDHVKVNMQLLSRTDTFSKEATLMASRSDQVDIYFTTSYILGQHVNSLDPIDFVPTDKYFDTAVEGLQYDGKQYAIPLDVGSNGLIYRTDLIEQMMDDPETYAEVSKKVLGEEMEPKEPENWDWDDFLAAGAYFTKSLNPDAPTTYGTSLQLKNQLQNVFLWDDVLWAYGGSWLDSKGEPNMDSDAGRKALDIYRTAYSEGIAAPASAQAEYPETQAAMTSGSVPFITQWTVGFTELNDAEKSPKTAGNVGIAPMPGPEHSTHVHTLAIGLNKYSKNKDAATTWMKYLTTEGAMKTYAESGGLPSYPSVLEELKDTNPLFGFTLNDIPENGYVIPTESGTYPTSVKLAEVLSGAWVGNTSVDKALKEADDVIKSTLKEGD
ncbi:extracellular solute-binding protein [Paramicrobacterium sp. CJ85]|uniref:extracellular solute-binding protein n=1 Tax=Paramicrobacterium sp. CJ85 TaxID=3445355 RepID=UPI003F626C92